MFLSTHHAAHLPETLGRSAGIAQRLHMRRALLFSPHTTHGLPASAASSFVTAYPLTRMTYVTTSIAKLSSPEKTLHLSPGVLSNVPHSFAKYRCQSERRREERGAVIREPKRTRSWLHKVAARGGTVPKNSEVVGPASRGGRARGLQWALVGRQSIVSSSVPGEPIFR